MLDLERVKKARLGHILNGDNRVYEIRGNNDGKAGQPTDRLTIKDELVAQSSAALHSYRTDLETELTTLKNNLETSQKVQENALGSLRQMEQKRSLALDEINKNQSGNQQEMQQRLKETEDHYGRIKAEVNGRPLRGGNLYIYTMLMVFVALVEWPINRLAFEAAFQEAPAVAALIAFAVGIAIACIAHFVGTIARHIEYYGKNRNKRLLPIITLVVLVVFVFFVIYVIALARHEFVKLLAVQNVSAASLFQNNIVSAVTEGFFTPSFTPSDWGLLVINLLVFTMAVAFSFAAHDPHPDYARVSRQRNKLQKVALKQKQKFDREFGDVSREHDEQIRTAQYQTVALSEEITNIQSHMTQIDRAIDDSLGLVSNAVARSISSYVLANRGARNGSGIPDFLTVQHDPAEIAHELRHRMAVG